MNKKQYNKIIHKIQDNTKYRKWFQNTQENNRNTKHRKIQKLQQQYKNIHKYKTLQQNTKNTNRIQKINKLQTNTRIQKLQTKQNDTKYRKYNGIQKATSNIRNSNTIQKNQQNILKYKKYNNTKIHKNTEIKIIIHKYQQSTKIPQYTKKKITKIQKTPIPTTVKNAPKNTRHIRKAKICCKMPRSVRITEHTNIKNIQYRNAKDIHKTYIQHIF